MRVVYQREAIIRHRKADLVQAIILNVYLLAISAGLS